MDRLLSNVALNRKRTIGNNRIRHSLVNEPVLYKIQKTQAPEALVIGGGGNQADDVNDAMNECNRMPDDDFQIQEEVENSDSEEQPGDLDDPTYKEYLDSSYVDDSEEDSSDTDDEYQLPDNLDLANDYRDNSERFIGIEEIEEERKNIDTGNFDVMDEIIMPWMSKRRNTVNNDQLGSEKIFPGSLFTVKDLANDVQNFVDSNGGSNIHARKSLEKDLMCNILLKYLPSNANNLPMQFTIKHKKRLYVSTIQNYISSNAFRNRTFWIDICSGSNNCVAYVGTYKDNIKCPECCSTRYKKCTRPKCAQLAYEKCVCDYTKNGRIAKKRQPYRSIIQLFVQLLESDSFVDLCNTLMAIPDRADMVDIQQGATYKKHILQCKERFETWKCEKNEEYRRDFININLMLSLFYDGIKVYNWKHSTFMPLIISILNLPPTYRCKFGVGQFIVGLLTVSQGSAGENVLLHCLMEELLILNEGIEIVTKNNKKYFLCVRLIQYLLDTPAAAKFFQYLDRGIAGCVYCGRISGKHLEHYKTVFIGHRFLLPLDHYLRIFGQTGTCCPRNFFPTRHVNRTNSLQEDQDRNHSLQVEELEFYGNNPNSAVVQWKHSVFKNKGLCIDTEEHRKNVDNFVLDQSRNKTFSWFCDMDQQIFDNYAYFLTCDLRPQCKPHNPANRFNEFMQLCSLAEREGIPIQGVKGFPLISRLPYFNFQEQFCPVNCHVIANNVKEFFDNVKGSNDTAKSKKLSEATNSFPWYYRKKPEDTGLLPWNMTPANRHILDAHINCIIVPLGYSQDFQVTNPFQQTDVLNMKGKFHSGITLMELIVHWSFSPFDIAYKAYYLLFSKALMELTRKKWAIDERIEMLHELERKINVLASIHEGILPLALQDFINHQMVDLCFGILLFGSTSGFNSFALERAGGIFKRWLKKGGVATEIGIMDKYDFIEQHMIDAIYSQKLKDIFKVPTKYKKVFEAINQRALMDNLDPNQLHFTDQRICLHDRIEQQSNGAHLSKSEVYFLLEELYKFIIMKIRVEGHHDSQAGYDSALCRVFYCFYGYRNSRIRLQDVTFEEYFDEVCDILGTDNAEETLLNVYGIGRLIGCLKKDGYLTADHADILLVSEFRSDLSNNMVVYKNAHVYGLTFRSRKITNADELKHNWNSPDNIKSWVKFIDYANEDTTQNTSFGRRAYNSTDKFMNINYFFRIDFPKEFQLHGMAIANGTSRNTFKTKCIHPIEWRKPTSSKRSSSSSSSSANQEASIQAPLDNDENNYLEHILVGNERSSLHQKSIFIPCVYFYATKVMIIPYHVKNFKFPAKTDAASLRKCINDAKPLLLKNKSIDIAREFIAYYAKCQPSAISFITMIDMHPSKCLDYSFNELIKGGNIQFIDRYLHNSRLDFA